MLRIWVVLFVSMALWVQPARAVYYTYSEWSALPEGSRTMYMSGAVDSLVTFAGNVDAFKVAQHYENCLRNAKMSNGQLATNILNYGKDKPAVHTQPAVGAMLSYLIAACGLPPQPPQPK